MKNLYLDCDGVILNTINAAYDIMRSENKDITDSDLVHEFFVGADWHKLITCGGVLNDSIEKIKYLMTLREYYIKILTTCVNIHEPELKKRFFKEALPEIEVITVPWLVRKDSIVEANGSILVDDSKRNINDWRESNGVGLHFVEGEANHNKLEIADLLDIPKVITEKILSKHL